MFTGSYEARDGRAMGVAVFLPSAVAVTPRSTIGFPNSDPVLHNIFLVDDPRVRTDLGTYPGGEDDNNGRKDVYAKIRHKWGGMRLVGEEPTLTHAHGWLRPTPRRGRERAPIARSSRRWRGGGHPA